MRCFYHERKIPYLHRVLTLKLRMERYEVELIEQYDKLNLYSIRIDGHEYTEFEEFVLRFSDNDEYKEDLDIVLSWLDNIIRRGALERYFRPEYRYGSGISAIPIETARFVFTVSEFRTRFLF